jgi:hypothetical protein
MAELVHDHAALCHAPGPVGPAQVAQCQVDLARGPAEPAARAGHPR